MGTVAGHAREHRPANDRLGHRSRRGLVVASPPGRGRRLGPRCGGDPRPRPQPGHARAEGVPADIHEMARAYVRAILVALEAVRSPHCGLLTSGQRVPFCECVPSERVPRVPSLGDEGAPQPEDPRGGPAPTTGGIRSDVSERRFWVCWSATDNAAPTCSTRHTGSTSAVKPDRRRHATGATTNPHQPVVSSPASAPAPRGSRRFPVPVVRGRCPTVVPCQTGGASVADACRGNG